jgi:hypothetical protein
MPARVGDRVEQAGQQGAVQVEDLHGGPVEADRDALPGPVGADRVLASG